MTTNHTSSIRQTITALKALTADGSISPSSLGTVLEGICSAVDALASAALAESDAKPFNTPGKLLKLDSSALVPKSAIPQLDKSNLSGSIINVENLMTQWLSNIWSLCCGFDQCLYPDLAETGGMIANKWITKANGTIEYVLYGQHLTQSQLIQALMDRWIPGTGGVQQIAVVNIPQRLKETDSDLSLAYTATNSSTPRVIALTRLGWEQTIAPVSVKRAFHGCSSVRTITGIISLHRVHSQEEAKSVFADCTNLRYFLIEFPSPEISELDLSGPGPYIANYWSWTDSAGVVHTQSTIEHLLSNLHGRTAPLKIIVNSQTTKNYILQNPAVQALMSQAACTITFTYEGDTSNPSFDL